MESWRKVWREGLAPLLSIRDLEVLRDALQRNDSKLLQGATTTPPPLQCVQDWLVEAACLISYPAVMRLGGFGVALVGETEEAFARTCFDIDQRLGEPAGCRWLMNWYDETERKEMIALLLPEVELALTQRTEEPCS